MPFGMVSGIDSSLITFNSIASGPVKQNLARAFVLARLSQPWPLEEGNVDTVDGFRESNFDRSDSPQGGMRVHPVTPEHPMRFGLATDPRRLDAAMDGHTHSGTLVCLGSHGGGSG
jgi:hypothetical protein